MNERERERLYLEARKLRRASDVETSDAAARADEAMKVGQRRDVLMLHAEYEEGLTDDEVDALLGRDLWRRCSDLRTLKLLAWKMKGDKPITRKARSGRQGRVSVLTEAGREALVR